MKHRIDLAEVLCDCVPKVALDDGLSGEPDLSGLSEERPFHAPPGNPTVFRTEAVAESGCHFGRLPGGEGREADFCPDTARIAVETKLVEDLAAARRARRSAAE